MLDSADMLTCEREAMVIVARYAPHDGKVKLPLRRHDAPGRNEPLVNLQPARRRYLHGIVQHALPAEGEIHMRCGGIHRVRIAHSAEIKAQRAALDGIGHARFKCADRAVKYQLIQNRLLENGGTPDFTRGTLEGDIAPSDITFFRLQCGSDGVLRAYVAEGAVLDVPTGSFGGIGVFAIPEMGRFYRHVLIEKRYPHHGAVAFGHYGKAIFSLLRYLGVADIAYNQPKSLPYPTENPFA